MTATTIPTNIVRVTFHTDGDGGLKSVWLRDPIDGVLNICGTEVATLSGVEVDRYGADVGGRDFDQRRRIIDRTAIKRVRAAVMNLHYAELEAVR